MAYAAEDRAHQTICLNMIVKNESSVIERCLGSVKHLIDYWIIVDTGSTDGTQEIIGKFMKDIPGELHERPWVDFATNRNEALQLAKDKSDYLLMIDADEILEFSDQFSLPVLDKDFYHMIVRQMHAADIKRITLINNHLQWQWKGILHEIITCPEAKTYALLQGVINYCDSGPKGGRSKDIDPKEKYLRDALLLEKGLKKEPDNSRYAYYLGQSYLAAEKPKLALKSFEKRITMSSSDLQETYLALYNIGVCYEKLENMDAAIESYFKAFNFRPTRAEPLFRNAVLYRKQGNYLLGYLLTKYALTLPYPTDDVCIEYLTYDYALLIEFANCAFILDKLDEGMQACSRLLANPNLPEDIKDKVTSNYEMAKSKISDCKKDIPLVQSK